MESFSLCLVTRIPRTLRFLESDIPTLGKSQSFVGCLKWSGQQAVVCAWQVWDSKHRPEGICRNMWISCTQVTASLTRLSSLKMSVLGFVSLLSTLIFVLSPRKICQNRQLNQVWKCHWTPLSVSRGFISNIWEVLVRSLWSTLSILSHLLSSCRTLHVRSLLLFVPLVSCLDFVTLRAVSWTVHQDWTLPLINLLLASACGSVDMLIMLLPPLETKFLLPSRGWQNRLMSCRNLPLSPWCHRLRQVSLAMHLCPVVLSHWFRWILVVFCWSLNHRCLMLPLSMHFASRPSVLGPGKPFWPIKGHFGQMMSCAGMLNSWWKLPINTIRFSWILFWKSRHANCPDPVFSDQTHFCSWTCPCRQSQGTIAGFLSCGLGTWNAWLLPVGMSLVLQAMASASFTRVWLPLLAPSLSLSMWFTGGSLLRSSVDCVPCVSSTTCFVASCCLPLWMRFVNFTPLPVPFLWNSWTLVQLSVDLGFDVLVWILKQQIVSTRCFLNMVWNPRKSRTVLRCWSKLLVWVVLSKPSRQPSHGDRWKRQPTNANQFSRWFSLKSLKMWSRNELIKVAWRAKGRSNPRRANPRSSLPHQRCLTRQSLLLGTTVLSPLMESWCHKFLCRPPDPRYHPHYCGGGCCVPWRLLFSMQTKPCCVHPSVGLLWEWFCVAKQMGNPCLLRLSWSSLVMSRSFPILHRPKKKPSMHRPAASKLRCTVMKLSLSGPRQFSHLWSMSLLACLHSRSVKKARSRTLVVATSGTLAPMIKWKTLFSTFGAGNGFPCLFAQLPQIMPNSSFLTCVVWPCCRCPCSTVQDEPESTSNPGLWIPEIQSSISKSCGFPKRLTTSCLGSNKQPIPKSLVLHVWAPDLVFDRNWMTRPLLPACWNLDQSSSVRPLVLTGSQSRNFAASGAGRRDHCIPAVLWRALWATCG